VLPVWCRMLPADVTGATAGTFASTPRSAVTSWCPSGFPRTRTMPIGDRCTHSITYVSSSCRPFGSACTYRRVRIRLSWRTTKEVTNPRRAVLQQALLVRTRQRVAQHKHHRARVPAHSMVIQR
jgi:hypothetical protein